MVVAGEEKEVAVTIAMYWLQGDGGLIFFFVIFKTFYYTVVAAAVTIAAAAAAAALTNSFQDQCGKFKKKKITC